MKPITKSLALPVICVATGTQETSRCDGCDQTSLLTVYAHKRGRKVILRIRLCVDCAP